MAHLTDHPEFVACIDGLAGLLCGERASNKAVFLSALARSRCRIIGLLTPREYEELVADDPDYNEFFSRVDVEEPDPQTAIQLLTQLAKSIERQFNLSIDAEAIRQAVLLSANYILNDHLPIKAMNILRRACEDLDYERLPASKIRS
jgi:ATP-dependent Clp protease ATP-binding subunit ClpA